MRRRTGQSALSLYISARRTSSADSENTTPRQIDRKPCPGHTAAHHVALWRHVSFPSVPPPPPPPPRALSPWDKTHCRRQTSRETSLGKPPLSARIQAPSITSGRASGPDRTLNWVVAIATFGVTGMTVRIAMETITRGTGSVIRDLTGVAAVASIITWIGVVRFVPLPATWIVSIGWLVRIVSMTTVTIVIITTSRESVPEVPPGTSFPIARFRFETFESAAIGAQTRTGVPSVGVRSVPLAVVCRVFWHTSPFSPTSHRIFAIRRPLRKTWSSLRGVWNVAFVRAVQKIRSPTAHSETKRRKAKGLNFNKEAAASPRGALWMARLLAWPVAMNDGGGGGGGRARGRDGQGKGGEGGWAARRRKGTEPHSRVWPSLSQIVKVILSLHHVTPGVIKRWKSPRSDVISNRIATVYLLTLPQSLSLLL